MKKNILKIKKELANNKGSAIVISILILGLIVIIVTSISYIYTNKLNTLKNLNSYYDNKIIEEINNIE